MKSKPWLNRKMGLAFGAATFALLVIGVISYRGMVVSGESEREVRHTHEVYETLQDLLFAMESVESNNRGFVATGNESYLVNYQHGVWRVHQDEAAIRRLTADNPAQQVLMPNLESLAAQRIARVDVVIGLRRTRGLRAATEAIRSGEGTEIMDAFQGVLRKLQAEEMRLLALRNSAAEQRVGHTKTALVFGTLLGLLITGGAGYSAWREGSRRGQAEEALGASEERYRMLLDGVQDYAIFMLDPKGQVVSWNAGAERIKGYTAEEIIGRNFSCFFSPEDIQRGRPEEVLRLTALNGRHEERSVRVREDGSPFAVNVTLTALRDPAGKLRGFSKVSRDISASSESEAKYRGLLEAAPDAMVVVNTVGEIILLNVQAEKQFGYSRDELVGQRVKNIIPEGFAERLIADGLRSTADQLAQEIGTGIELIGRRKNGTDFPIEI